MQVLVGPTYNMDMSASSSSPVCVMDRSSTISSGIPASAAAAQDNKINNAASSSSCMFLNGGNINGVVVGDQNTYGSENDSSDSSSIGAPGDSEDEDEEDDVVSSSEKGVGLQKNKFSMDSLEDSLTSKRGLSNHYSGKSKSFGNLTEMVSKSSAMAIKELEKEENPFNKRRRLLIASKWSRKFFYCSQHKPNKSMPLLPILPDDVEEDENPEANNHGDKEENEQLLQNGNKLNVKMMGFKSQSCFCLADLAEEEEEEDDDCYS